LRPIFLYKRIEVIMGRALLVLTLSTILSGCATVERQACTSGEKSTVSEAIYFGMAKPTGGVVSQEEWSDFLRTVVTPHFPAGLTVWPASGQWRGADGQVVREDSYVLNLIHPVDASAEEGIRAIIAQYKTRFAQEAVLRVRSNVCTSL
jgi:hypothetical protein